MSSGKESELAVIIPISRFSFTFSDINKVVATNLVANNQFTMRSVTKCRSSRGREFRRLAFLAQIIKTPINLTEIGVDILNPVQVSATNMDTRKLKKEFSRDLTFGRGGIDTQRVLQMGRPQQVKEEVKKRIEDLAAGGGFVFSAVHCIQKDVPPENIQAMWEALQEYGKY